MPHVRRKSATTLDPRGATRVRYASAWSPGWRRSGRDPYHPGSDALRVELAEVPARAEVELSVRLEAVHRGRPRHRHRDGAGVGECARCLEPLTSSVEASFQELYHYEPSRRKPKKKRTSCCSRVTCSTWSRCCATRWCSHCRCRRCARTTARACAPSAGSGWRTPGRDTSTTTRSSPSGRRCVSSMDLNRRPDRPPERRRRPTGEAEVAVPKRRMSRSNTRSRRSQWKTSAPTLVSLPAVP